MGQIILVISIDQPWGFSLITLRRSAFHTRSFRDLLAKLAFQWAKSIIQKKLGSVLSFTVSLRANWVLYERYLERELVVVVLGIDRRCAPFVSGSRTQYRTASLTE